jgi:hypothetical protein
VGIDPVDKVNLTISGAVAIGATKINLAGKINNSVGIAAGTPLIFGAVTVTTSMYASSDDTSVSIFAAPAAIADAAVCNYPGYGARPVKSGMPVGRTYAERDAGTPFGAADAADDELYLVAFDVADVMEMNEIVLVRYGTRIKENRLPGFAALAAGIKTKLRTNYQMYRGT